MSPETQPAALTQHSARSVTKSPTPSTPQSTPAPTTSPTPPPNCSRRKAALTAHHTISSLYAPFLLDDDTTNSDFSIHTKTLSPHRDLSSDSSSDEFIADSEASPSRAKKALRLQKRKRGRKAKMNAKVAEMPGRLEWEDRTLVAEAEGRVLRGRNKRGRKAGEAAIVPAGETETPGGRCGMNGMSSERAAALNAVTENEVLEYCQEVSMG